MHKVLFYQDKNGDMPVKEYLEGLRARTDKDSRIKLNKIRDYVKALSEYGTFIGEPYVKHLEGDIWELRPLRDRILFVAWIDNSFILLHHFLKKTQKTPAREIERAKRELADLRAGGGYYEEE
ncbi:MAG: type II toxin-antitoxin system RelE/ParE family toxin [Acidaminococcaceae bacterium]|nr:type II toxin-antitoxin system RelE/ParE family toxin [Acidaminococcaceae bacterium]